MLALKDISAHVLACFYFLTAPCNRAVVGIGYSEEH